MHASICAHVSLMQNFALFGHVFHLLFLSIESRCRCPDAHFNVALQPSAVVSVVSLAYILEVWNLEGILPGGYCPSFLMMGVKNFMSRWFRSLSSRVVSVGTKSRLFQKNSTLRYQH